MDNVESGGLMRRKTGIRVLRIFRVGGFRVFRVVGTALHKRKLGGVAFGHTAFFLPGTAACNRGRVRMKCGMGLGV